MDIFASDWLIAMLKKASKTPQGRMLALYDVLGDWLNAPEVKLDFEPNIEARQPLILFFIAQAKSCNADHPESLAQHLVLIAYNALKTQIATPSSKSLIHAKKVAHALIVSQTMRHTKVKRIASVALAASFVGILTGGVVWQLLDQTTQTQLIAQSEQYVHALGLNTQTTGTNRKPLIPENKVLLVEKNVTSLKNTTSITASDAVAMYAKFDEMRKGTCQFAEVLQIPDKHKTVYIENVVGGKVPTNLKDLAIANYYLGRVRCNFTPMLMANSK